ncbi:MAG TPA: hypothetical protein VIJ78_05840 [Pseudolabrys sp.]
MKTYLGLIFAIVCLASPPASAQYWEDQQADRLKANVLVMKKNINKQVWVTRTDVLIELCPYSTGQFKECKALKPGDSFAIKELVLNGPRPPEKPMMYDNMMYRVQMTDGRVGYVPTNEYQVFTTEDPQVTREKEETRRKAAIEDCTKRGQPHIGMKPSEAIETCWGKPRRIVKSTTAAGVREDYIYSIGHILRFEDGILATIIETRGQ